MTGVLLPKMATRLIHDENETYDSSESLHILLNHSDLNITYYICSAVD
jgi:hypothetical protein